MGVTRRMFGTWLHKTKNQNKKNVKQDYANQYWISDHVKNFVHKFQLSRKGLKNEQVKDTKSQRQ